MPLEVRLSRRAAKQIEAAAVWWAENRPAAPDALFEELAQAFELISRQPRVGAAANPGSALRGVRRLHLSRVHYHLYYRESRGALVILALWHTSRRAGPL